MASQLPILDSEAHVIEPLDLWNKYLEPAFQSRAPTFREAQRSQGEEGMSDVVNQARFHYACARQGLSPEAVQRALDLSSPGFHNMEIDGELLLGPVAQRVWHRGAMQALVHYLPQMLAGYDAASHVDTLRAMGVERAYLYPTKGLFLFAVDSLEPALTAALVRAYNDWLREFSAHAPEFLRGVGALCQHDPEQMVSELERIASWGWKAVMLRPNPVRGRMLSDPAYERFWTRCEALDVAVGVHEGTHARVPTLGSERFQTHFARHVCSHPLEQMTALLALIEGGVLERHPRLRVGFLEAGCGWLPYWLSRMDAKYADVKWEVRDNVRMKPSDYFRRQCFITCEANEPGIELVIDMVGEGCVLFGSDYPHVDHPPRIREDSALLVERLTPAVARRVLWDNGCRFYEGRS
ncbi:amidohydrolase family protein [Cystobacter fuscus]|uniref:amidohydrolase family protein n=1 Tax=Cystobacter fuscus TaxID=43 RepID=UPI002B30ED29|nr:amidohydrolase [Cystobacter fuscus]